MPPADTTAIDDSSARRRAGGPALDREFVMVAAGQGAALVTTALAVKILAGRLGPSEYGRLALMLTLAGLPNMVLFGPLGQGVSRFFPNADHDASDARVAVAAYEAQRYAAYATAGLAAAAALLAGFGVGGLSPAIAAAAVLCGIAPGFVGNAVATLSARRHRVLAGALQAGEPLARLLGAVALLALAPSAEWALLGGAAGTALFIAAFDGRVRPRFNARPGREDRKALSDYVVPFSIGAAPALVVAYADRWIVGTHLDSQAVGLYVLALQVSSIAVMPLVGVLNQYFMPIVFAAASAPAVAAGYMRRWIMAIALCAIPAVLAAWLWARGIVSLASSEEFADAAVVLPITVAATALLWVGNVGCIEAEVMKRPRLTLLPKAAHAALVVVAGVLMTRRWGVIGMATAAFLSAAAFAVIVRLTVGREYRKNP